MFKTRGGGSKAVWTMLKKRRFGTGGRPFAHSCTFSFCDCSVGVFFFHLSQNKMWIIVHGRNWHFVAKKLNLASLRRTPDKNPSHLPEVWVRFKCESRLGGIWWRFDGDLRDQMSVGWASLANIQSTPLCSWSVKYIRIITFNHFFTMVPVHDQTDDEPSTEPALCSSLWQGVI